MLHRTYLYKFEYNSHNKNMHKFFYIHQNMILYNLLNMNLHTRANIEQYNLIYNRPHNCRHMKLISD